MRNEKPCGLNLGACLTAGGVSFAVHSRHALAIDLCLFESEHPANEHARIRMERIESDLWHCTVPGLAAGALYGFRAHGAWLPATGFRYNPAKLLLDPYAKAVIGRACGARSMLTMPGPNKLPGCLNSAQTAPKAAVIDGSFDWGDDRPPRRAWSDTVIYELHVKGFTKLHPDLPDSLRGTYAGLAHPLILDYLKCLGITAVQLLPVQQHLDDGFLVDRGLSNYWGYNTIGFFAPHAEYASCDDPSDQVREFKSMVKALHAAGIEVILDVVYNHTGEGDENGPSLLFRGFDNTSYYRFDFRVDSLTYQNMTGCGNAVASHEPPALRLILDSLRYWVTEMHVDGFRFDLAVTVGRDKERFSLLSPFFTALQQDPVLSRIKLIAEPWDVGCEDSYQVGQFPEPWRELNGKYRDTVRRFWRGDAGTTAEFAKRLCGSDDIYGWNRRPPLASVNFVTSHDGFTLHDLVSYREKHNQANGEGNRDGDNDNHSWNCGVEGVTVEQKVLDARDQSKRAMIATLCCSLGVPFINAGDERGRTQQGNNNAYCQDNEISWIDWRETCQGVALKDFLTNMLIFRRRHPALRRSEFFDGRFNQGTGARDVTWLNSRGEFLSREEWHDPACASFGAMLGPTETGHQPLGQDGDDHRPLLLLFHQGGTSVDFRLPGDAKTVWGLEFDTSERQPFVHGALECRGGEQYSLQGGSVVCLLMKNYQPATRALNKRCDGRPTSQSADA